MCPKRRWHEQACRISRHQQPILLACPIPGPILEFYRPVTRPDLLMRVVGSPGAESMLERPDGVSQQGSRPAEQRDPSSRRACRTPWLRLSTAGGWLCPARTCGLEHGFGQPVQPANCGQRGSCCRGVHGARSARDRPVFQPKLPRVRGVCLYCIHLLKDRVVCYMCARLLCQTTRFHGHCHSCIKRLISRQKSNLQSLAA